MALATFTATVVVRPRSMRALDTRIASSMNSRYPRVDAAARGWVELEFEVRAGDMSDAMVKAISMARTVSGASPLSCQVTSHGEELVEGDGPARGGRHAGPGERMLRPSRLA